MLILKIEADIITSITMQLSIIKGKERKHENREHRKTGTVRETGDRSDRI